MKFSFSLALLSLCCCLCVACKKNTAQTAAGVSAQVEAVQKKPQTADDVKNRVEAIYKEVCAAYNKANEMDLAAGMKMLQDKHFDKDYCSAAWNQAVAQVMEKDQQDADGMPFFDFDYWVMGQDFNQMSVADVKVESLDGDQALVSLILRNSGSDNHVKLKMVYERDEWMIDDFITNYEGEDDSLRADMAEYLAQ